MGAYDGITTGADEVSMVGQPQRELKSEPSGIEA